MWKYKLIGLAMFLKSLSGKVDFEATRLDVVQDRKYYDIAMAGEVDLPEISGLTKWQDTFYGITDSGGEEAIYLFSNSIVILDTINLKSVQNKDWETITSDSYGKLYIGDFGNNLNRRKDLRIFIVSDERVDTIKFKYAEQKNFPPEKKEMNFDCEAMFWSEGNLHLFSKNRGEKCVKHYIISDQAGEYDLIPQEELKLNAMITGAAVNPKGDVVVLMGYGKIYFFKKDGKRIFEKPLMIIETTKLAQNEAVVFMDDSTLLLCNETGKFFKITFELPKEN